MLDLFFEEIGKGHFVGSIKFDLKPKPTNAESPSSNTIFYVEFTENQAEIKDKIQLVDLIFRTRIDNFRRCLKGMNWGSFSDSLLLKDLTLGGEISNIGDFEKILTDYDKNHDKNHKLPKQDILTT